MPWWRRGADVYIEVYAWNACGIFCMRDIAHSSGLEWC